MSGGGVTIGSLARTFGLSRSTLLYYDRLGLLRPAGRSGSNYRVYSTADVERLEQICAYRRMGIPLKEIGRILDEAHPDSAAGALRRRLQALAERIGELRRQQLDIVRLLGQPELMADPEMLDKDRWVAVMEAAGIDEEGRRNWHRQFEKMEPEAHQEFLELIGFDAADVKRIREWSRT
jgi:DNA-binding transcriptional MerR regulator